MDVQDASLAEITNMLARGYNGGTWAGTGINSSAAVSDSTHLTAIGVILNNDGNDNLIYGSGSTAGLFEGFNPSLNDVLVKYTYYGDTNLDGKVDGSDYSRVDNGFLNHLTSWYNGDFNYDEVIDGSDYSLIDNAFNTQGAQYASLITRDKSSSPCEQGSSPALLDGKTAKHANSLPVAQTPRFKEGNDEKPNAAVEGLAGRIVGYASRVPALDQCSIRLSPVWHRVRKTFRRSAGQNHGIEVPGDPQRIDSVSSKLP